MSEKLIVIGNGMAAGRVLDHLLEADPSRFAVTVFGAEPRVNYNRIMLSPVLSGEKDFADIIIHDEEWYPSHKIDLRRGRTIVAIDRDAKHVVDDQGERTAYDKLLVATGSMPFIIPAPGNDLKGVVTYRDLDDVNAMLAAAEKGGSAVVIGGGLLGLEAAAGLAMRGMKVTVVHIMATLMERQLDAAAGYLLQKAIEQRGIDVITKANTKAIIGKDGRVSAVELEDGQRIPADLVVMAVGIRPNAALARDSGLGVNRGVVVDDFMRTNDPDVFAIGECVEHRGQCYGLVAPLFEMAKVVAARLRDDPEPTYEGSTLSTKLKVTGIDLFSAGDFAEGGDREEIVLRDAARGVYKRLVLRDARLIGAVMYGDTSDSAWFFDLLKTGADVSEMRDVLIFGQSFAGGAQADPMSAVAALPDGAEICGCNGVCKGAIVEAIVTKGLTDVNGVRAHTKASASCGTCTGLVEQLLAVTLGDGFQKAAVEPMCACTDLGHADVRRLIIAKELKTVPAVMQELEWRSSCGCAKCRPALNYYLLCDWPDEYEDDSQSRYINERVHANIQKDGTYSVVPRMWGGLTSARELRAIADVADKFNIPTVKVTGGQRIDLLGVKKQDLPGVWADLNRAGMVSGHAYAKGLRTVKTCVGTDWCRFGTQDSTGLGVKIEKFMWGSWTPHKLKMAVSGCPRNCAESTCKDIGVICTDGGYDILFGGAAGLHLRETELLCKVTTEEACIEHIAALTQLYREQGFYLERIYKWARRVGLGVIRGQVVHDEARRKALFQRFVFSQRKAQVDPWAERVSGKDSHEFSPIARLELMEAAQ
jgi:nitrite reductase (NADH) large subunit